MAQSRLSIATASAQTNVASSFSTGAVIAVMSHPDFREATLGRSDRAVYPGLRSAEAVVQHGGQGIGEEAILLLSSGPLAGLADALPPMLDDSFG